MVKFLFKLGLILLVGGLILLLILFSSQSPSVEIISAPEENKLEGKKIVIDVAGAVEKPGVYQLPADSRINDALIAAGGLSVEADRGWVAKNINLAAPLKDGIKIYIKSTKEIDNSTRMSNKINLNTASLAELDRLPGIGQVLGQRIINYRLQNGPFQNPEDLLKVEGISQKIFEGLKDQISLW